VTKRSEEKDLYLAALRGDAKAQRACTERGKACGGRCIPKHWNCRIKGEGDTPPTRGNAVQLSAEQKAKIRKARQQRRIRSGLKVAGTIAGVAGAAAGAAALARKNPQAMRRAASKAGLGANFAGMVSNIPGPVGSAAAVANLGLGAFQAGATAGASLGSNRRGVARLRQLKTSIAAREKVIRRTEARVADLKGTRNSFEVAKTQLLGRMGDSGSKAQQRTLKSLTSAINRKNGEIATAQAKLSALIRRNASLTRGMRKIEGLLGGQYNTAEKIYKSVEQTNQRFRAGRRQTSAIRPKGRRGPKPDRRSWQERFGMDEAEREDKKCGNSGIPDNTKCTKKNTARTIAKAAAGAALVVGGAAALRSRRRVGSKFRQTGLTPYQKEQLKKMRAKGTGKYGARGWRKTGRSFRPDIEAIQGDAEGKKFSKTVTNPKTGRKRTIKYGAKGYSIAPGTKKGDRYCARSFGDMKSHGKDCSGKDRNTPLCLSRAKWKCSGKSSRKDAGEKRRGKPCGASYISKSKECRIQKGSGWSKVAAVAGIAAVAAGGYALSQRNPDRDRKPRLSPAERKAARLARQDRMSEEQARRITNEAIKDGKVWDVQEKINQRRKAQIDAQCGGGLGKIQAPAKFDAMVRQPRCQVGEGAYGTYFVHTSGKYGVKVFRNGDEDDVEKEFDLLDRARSAGVNVPRPLAQNAVLDEDGYTKSQTLVLEHMRGYKEAAKLYPSGGDNLSKAPLIVQVKALREFRKLNVEGLAHGDIHGGNILVNPSSKKVALIDFGYATEIDDVTHPQHGRSGVETLMDDLHNVRRFVGANTEFLEEKSQPILQNIRKNAENYHRDWDKFEVSVKRYYDFVEAELLYDERKPRSRFVRSADQLRIPDLTRRILTANRDSQQRRLMVQLMNEMPSRAEIMAKNIGVKKQRLFLALKPERDQLAARIKAQPFGTPL